MPHESTEPSGKNPKRVLAGQKNRALRGPLSAAGLERLRQAALAHKPWERSTGPITEAGKAQAAVNGAARQTRRLSIRKTRRLMAEVREVLQAAREVRVRVKAESG